MSECIVKHELGYVVMVATKMYFPTGFADESVLWDVAYIDIKEGATVFRSFNDFLRSGVENLNEYFEEGV